MTHEETVSTLIRVADDAAAAVSWCLEACRPDNDSADIEMIEMALCDALARLLDETDAAADQARGPLLTALQIYMGEA